jgi:hypothetical protein
MFKTERAVMRRALSGAFPSHRPVSQTAAVVPARSEAKAVEVQSTLRVLFTLPLLAVREAGVIFVCTKFVLKASKCINSKCLGMRDSRPRHNEIWLNKNGRPLTFQPGPRET